MPMTKPLTAGSFDPETTSLLATAFEKAWQTILASQVRRQIR